jgi:Tfp pilus assembly protein PilO
MKIDNRQQFLAVVSMAAVLLLAADRLVYTPLAALWKSRSVRIAELRQQIATGTSLLQREQVIRRHWDLMQTNALPRNSSLAEQQLLKAFDAWSQRSHVSLTSMMPQWEQDSDDYMTLVCRVEATGNLDALSQFIYNIEKDPMALKLESMELTARDDDGQQMTLGLQVSGLVLTPEIK